MGRIGMRAGALVTLFSLLPLSVYSAPAPSTGFIDFSPESAVISEYGSAVASIIPPGAQELPLMSSGDPVIIPSSPPARLSPTISSISEKIYSGTAESNNRSFNRHIGGSGSDSEWESVNCADPFMLVSLTPLACGAPEDTLPVTTENTRVYGEGRGSVIVQTVTRSHFPTLVGISRQLQVEYVSPDTVRIIAEQEGILEDYALQYKRRGEVMESFPSQYRDLYPPGSYCIDVGNKDSTDTVCNDGTMLRGDRALVYRWVTGWGQDYRTTGEELADYTGTCGSGDDTYDCATVLGAKILPQNPISLPKETIVISPARPLNSDIVYLSPKKCRYESHSGLWRSTESLTCVTYGLAADGRVGTANYHESDSSIGGFLAVFGLAVSVFVPVLAPEIISTMVATFGAELVAAFSVLSNIGSAYQLVASDSSTPQMSSVPSALGKVEDSDHMGLGTWSWLGGFDLAALAVQEPPPTTEPSVVTNESPTINPTNQIPPVSNPSNTVTQTTINPSTDSSGTGTQPPTLNSLPSAGPLILTAPPGPIYDSPAPPPSPYPSAVTAKLRKTVGGAESFSLTVSQEEPFQYVWTAGDNNTTYYESKISVSDRTHYSDWKRIDSNPPTSTLWPLTPTAPACIPTAPGTYYAKGRACNVEGCGWESIETVLTVTPTTPLAITPRIRSLHSDNLQELSISPTDTFQLYWTQAGCSATYYQSSINVCALDGTSCSGWSEWGTVKDAAGATTTSTVWPSDPMAPSDQDLQLPSGKYYMKGRACNESGCGPTSETVILSVYPP